MKLPRIECDAAIIDLIAFLAVLVAIVLLSLASAKPDLSIVTGLVGVLGGLIRTQRHKPGKDAE